MKIDITVRECDLVVTGEYKKGEPDVNLDSSFEISDVRCSGDLSNLIEWASAGRDLVDLEILVIDQIEKDEEDYEDKD